MDLCLYRSMAEADSNRGPPTYQPKSLALGQAGLTLSAQDPSHGLQIRSRRHTLFYHTHGHRTSGLS